MDYYVYEYLRTDNTPYYIGKGRKNSPETIQKIKEARAKQVITTIQVTCPHCGKIGGNRIMPRYHFDNCKFNTN